MKENIQDIIAVLESNIADKHGKSVHISDDLKKTLAILMTKLRSKWDDASRKTDRFFKNNEQWLKGEIHFPTSISVNAETAAQDIPDESTSRDRGRPFKSFDTSSDRSKRRKTEEIRKTFTADELAYATQMSLRSTGNLEAAKVVKDVSSTSPTRAAKYVTAFQSKMEETFTPDEALSLMLESKISKQAYQTTRNEAKKKGCKLFPSYKHVEKAKKMCYPPDFYVNVTETSAEVKLQVILDKTVARILKLQEDVIRNISPAHVKNVKLYCKWGCDGSSGQSVYKQKFSEDGKSDESVFFTSFVPIKLVSEMEMTEIVIWQNPRPSSPRFCRPIRLQFLHENVQTTMTEVTNIEEQIQRLEPYQTIKEKPIFVTYSMSFTMIDGKVCNAISGTISAQRCFLCEATPKQFNDIDAMLKKNVKTDNLRFGISTLHAWIRFFECFLHISYKIDVEKWQRSRVKKEANEEKKAKAKEINEKIDKKKRDVQEQFRSQLGLVVDRPKPGFGSSNDGNTARRFFENSAVSAKITGVDESLIHRFHVILKAMSSGYDVDVVKFNEYCLNTARLYVELYSWYHMPTSVHKILIHGAIIINHALLPIGQLSEDAQESRNKDIKRYRQDFSRKCSRKANMADVFNRLMVTSDPVISSIRKLPQKPLKTLVFEVVQLLQPPTISENEVSFNTSTESTPTTSESETESNVSDDEENDFCY